jgi:hypothetical protein
LLRLMSGKRLKIKRQSKKVRKQESKKVRK